MKQVWGQIRFPRGWTGHVPVSHIPDEDMRMEKSWDGDREERRVGELCSAPQRLAGKLS